MNIARCITFFNRLVIFGVVLSWQLSAQEVAVSASVNKNPVALDEDFTFRVEITGTSQDLPAPKLPELDNFMVLSGPNTSTSIQILNGKVSSRRGYSYVLLPKKAGSFTIPAITISHNDKEYHSEPVVITVNEAGKGSADGKTKAADDHKKEVFLKAFPSKETVYVNEQLNVTYKLYFKSKVRNPEVLEAPKTFGFWVEDYELPENISVAQEILDGVEYQVAELKRMALLPTKIGTLTITPLRLAINVSRPVQADYFDEFFQNPFGQFVKKILTSREIQIQVLPLPEQSQNTNFSGLVGQFEVKSTLDKSMVSANEAILLKIEIKGRGSLKSLQQLPLKFPDSFEIYDPKIKETIDRKTKWMATSKDLEYVLIPRLPGKYRIKPMEMSYFDPDKQQYQILRTPEYIINVDKSSKSVASSVSVNGMKIFKEDIHFIKEKFLGVVPINDAPYKSFGFWAAIILPLMLLGGMYALHDYQQRISSNVEYVRKRKAFKQANQKLREAKQYLVQEKFGEFYSEISKGLIGFIADKANFSANGVLMEDVVRILEERDVDEVLVSEYRKCLEEADFFRFAPGEVTLDKAETFYRQTENLLVRLEKAF